MPVNFLTHEQRASFGRYQGAPSQENLARYFHLDDTDRVRIAEKRGDHNRLGFALQLGTVRYLGKFLDDPLEVPSLVMHTVSKQLGISAANGIDSYRLGRQRLQHAMEIRAAYGYTEITEPRVGFRLTRWLYALCWTGTDRPGVLFECATAWLMTHKVLLPGCSTLERYIAKLRGRVEERLWRSLAQCVGAAQAERLERLLTVPTGSRNSPLDQLRNGPVMVSSVSLVQALQRLRTVRELGVKLPVPAHIPDSRVAALARYASSAKASAIQRMPNLRRLATLVAFAHCMEATAQDDALEVLEALLRTLFNDAIQADRKARQRTLKDLDQAAATLANACRIVLDQALADVELRAKLFERVPRELLAQAVESVNALVRPADDVYFNELDARFRTVRRFLPTLIEQIHFAANVAGEPLVAALDWLGTNLTGSVAIRASGRAKLV